MAGEELKVPISVPVETNAAEAGDSVESLRESIMGSTESIRAMAGTLKQLRGTSDEVKSAKTALTAKIEALRGSVSSASLALVKQGTTYDAAAQKEKKYLEQKKKLSAELKKAGEDKAKDKTNAMSSAISHAGGPVAALKGKLDALKSVMGESSGASGLLTLGMAGLVAAAAAFVVGVVAAGVALGKFILTSANAARDANLLREAWSGTAKNASNLGTQVDALSMKVPTSKAALNDLSIALMKMRLPGAATVDAFNAIGQASAALGEQGGAKLQEFIDRAKLFSHTGKGFRLAQADFADGALGNLEFGGVATALAKNLGIGIAEAKERLRVGAVSVAQGAKAMRDATEKTFGGLNLRKMMSFEVMTRKLGERFDALTKGVDLEPLLKPLSELGKLFDESTVTGSTLKMLVTSFGKGMVAGLVKGIPIAKAFFEGLVIGSLQAYIAFLKVKNALAATFGDSKMLKDVDVLSLALSAGKVAAVGIAGAVVLIGGVMAAGLAPIVAMGAAFVWLGTASERLGLAMREGLQTIDWKGLGASMIDGLIAGWTGSAHKVLDVVKGLGTSIKKAFTGEMEIHSPSKAFFRYGEAMPEGVVGGVEKGAPAAQSAVSSMVGVPSGGGGAAGGGGGGVVVNVSINVAGGGGETAAAQLSESSFLAKLTKAVEDALVGAGIPVQA